MFLINGITREITSDAPKEDFLFGVTSDEKANIKYFKGPRYTKNSVDLASASIRINYINGGAETDQYIVTDLEADEEYITFSWTFHRNVTKYKGAVQFIVCAVKCDADGSITNEWNTTSAKGTVQQGIEVDGSEYEEETADAIESILLAAQNRINAMVVDDTLSQAGVAADAAATGAAIESLTKELENDFSQLSEEIGDLKGNEATGISAELTGALRAYFTNMQTLLPQLAYAIDENIGNALIENAKNVVIVLGGGEEEEPTLLRISAIYNGGIVPIGTALTDLTGIMVTGTYTDGSVSEITGYTLTGEIVGGNNTITVTYGGKTTTFTVPCYVYDNIYNYAHDNVLLSEQKDFVTATIYSGATEELTEDGLHLSIPSNTRNNRDVIKYVLIPDKVSCGILTAKVKINSVPRVVNTKEGAIGFRLQLSNGSSGVQIYMCKNQNGNPVLYACEDNSVIEIGTFVIGTWYEITVELSTDGQYIFVNGEKIYSSDTLSSLYCTENRVIITAIADRVDVDTDVHVEYIAFKEDI